jgi:hypothetical protein
MCIGVQEAMGCACLCLKFQMNYVLLVIRKGPRSSMHEYDVCMEKVCLMLNSSIPHGCHKETNFKCLYELICLLLFNVLVLESTCAIMMLPKLLEKKSSNNDQNELLTILCVSTLLFMCM